MAELSRRGFVTAAGVSGIGLLLSTSTAHALDRALRESVRRTVDPAGTTLESVATPVTPGPAYSRLTAGPGWPLVVREDLAPAAAGRDDRRTALASFAQFTDLHITDAQCPARFEYLHPLVGSAHRPQETLGPVATTALVNRVNALAGGPVTGRPLDFMMTTGDNTDNHEHVELAWFLDILNGGTVTPNTGDPSRYEGVQDSGSAHYWNPGRALDDAYTRKGFPRVPGLLDAAISPFTSPGLRIPWYCTFGNHDDTPVGTLPAGIPSIEHWYTGRYKVIGKDDGASRALADALRTPGASVPVTQLFGGSGTVREVTPDERRRPFTTAEFVRAHLDPANTGPGPVGHGFTDGNADGRDVYYTFRIAPGITGISLDTTTLGGFADGSIGLGQYLWVERTLRRASSTYYTAWGGRVSQDVTDELFILFSHHTSGTMGNVLPDLRHPLEPRLTGPTFVDLLHRFPNVLAWVNGHTHQNALIPHTGRTPRQSFWEVNTASHIDFPQLARIIEVTDNADGTLSLFTTLVEAEAPYAADYADTAARALAAHYRELSYNDLHAEAGRAGAPGDRNAELVLTHPLR
ncbi:metallophosphoesterase, PPA1498 family [Amycolatopsis arida]|uniref:Metallophosphoesterase, PPA1498 family n=1 Tax=Amycolatopsis arida TaxID=587909 RepID=A0A1I5QGX0_9PSEU|nr:TIGR03767 family metallophosphoesterase [Amycolatopsis arida]TDX98832.1 metallophosphoesterase (TIGR03767 family) [Amycolatopsis arida]SFP45291.1 metallophosphoesterase, PPA1498 family [Amycolatopsis arida]